MKHSISKICSAFAIQLLVVAGCSLTTNTAISAPAVEVVPLQRGSEVTLVSQWKPNAVATLVLFTGGDGGVGHTDAALEDGDPNARWPRGNNFMLRVAPLLGGLPYNVVIFGTANDRKDLSWEERTSDSHVSDIGTVLALLRRRSDSPIWLIGTSRGTVSAVGATIKYQGKYVDGLIMTSSPLFGKAGAMDTQPLEKLRVPTLLVQHRDDACRVCLSHAMPDTFQRLSSAPSARAVLMSGGMAKGDPCQGLSYHGFPGVETEVVGIMSDWIQSTIGGVGPTHKLPSLASYPNATEVLTKDSTPRSTSWFASTSHDYQPRDSGGNGGTKEERRARKLQMQQGN